MCESHLSGLGGWWEQLGWSWKGLLSPGLPVGWGLAGLTVGTSAPELGSPGSCAHFITADLGILPQAPTPFHQILREVWDSKENQQELSVAITF